MEALELTRAMRDVIAERGRQVEVEGYTPDHDDEHGNGELARLAAAYCINHSVSTYRYAPGLSAICVMIADTVKGWFKPKDSRRDLVRAAALIVAEIERIDRAAALACGGA